MRFRSFLSFLFAVTLGAVVAVVIKIGFALPGFLPTSDLFMFILDSPLGKYALKTRGGEGGVLIAIAMRAFTCSVIVGAVAGVMLRKIRFQRSFCYAALWLPFVDVIFGYLALSAASVTHSEQVAVMQKNFGHVVWADLWIYGWYFLALCVSFIVTKHISHRSSMTPNSAS